MPISFFSCLLPHIPAYESMHKSTGNIGTRLFFFQGPRDTSTINIDVSSVKYQVITDPPTFSLSTGATTGVVTTGSTTGTTGLPANGN